MATLGNFIGNVGFYNKNGELAIELPCYEIVRNSADESLTVPSDNKPVGEMGVPVADLLPQLNAAGCNGYKYSSATLATSAVTPQDASNTISIAIWRRDSEIIQYLLFDSGTKLSSSYTGTSRVTSTLLLMGKDVLTGTYHLMYMWLESYSSSAGIYATEASSLDEYPVTSVTFTSTVTPDKPATAETPTITQNLPLFGKVTYEQGDVADTLTIAAEVSDGGTLTYQWYKDDAAIAGATESSYTPSVEVGSAVYYCVVTNTLGEANATAQSESVAIIGYVVFLAASEPVPVGIAPEIDPVSMTLGWLIGCRIAGQRGKGGVMPEEPEVPEVPVGEPVAYLYNSRRLPGLPEWTKDYEIVTIVDPNLGDTYIKAAKGYTIESSWNITYGTHHTTYGVDVVRSYLKSREWQEPVAQTDDWLWSNSPYLNDGSTYPFWSNTDLICKNDDGTEYVGLAGSEPVPVYE